MYNSPIALDQISESQAGKAATANAILSALAAGALFGVHSASGLTVVFYGGNMSIAGVPTAIADQTISLTANATNYIYATSAGVVTKTTSIPGSWPGPLAAGAIALYSFVTGASTITSGICYLIGLGAAGGAGVTGATGATGSDFASTRKHWTQAVGGGSTTISLEGFGTATVTNAAVARTLASTSLRESIPYVGYESAAGAGSSMQVHHPQNWCYLGNATGRGGFNLAMRICMENSLIASPANQRSFFGLFTPGTIGNVEPDTIINMIGFGAKAGDANLSFIHNDGSGTATMVGLGSSFPARATDNVYELLLQSTANSGTVTYQITDVGTGNVASGNTSSDLPSNTTFLTWVMWINNGSTASKASFGFMQIVGETRY
jgi:hypothetical protein